MVGDDYAAGAYERRLRRLDADPRVSGILVL